MARYCKILALSPAQAAFSLEGYSHKRSSSLLTPLCKDAQKKKKKGNCPNDHHWAYANEWFTLRVWTAEE
jgi:hypothetical protein